jgi:uncharacterized coiled-coil protein SlyX
MSEETPCHAEAVKRPEPDCGNSSNAHELALAALTQALTAQNFHLAQLVQSLNTLTQQLVSLIELTENQKDEDQGPFATLS